MATTFSYVQITNNGREKWFLSRFNLDMTLFKNITVENTLNQVAGVLI